VEEIRENKLTLHSPSCFKSGFTLDSAIVSSVLVFSTSCFPSVWLESSLSFGSVVAVVVDVEEGSMTIVSFYDVVIIIRFALLSRFLLPVLIWEYIVAFQYVFVGSVLT
jgi:hypothetical protein